jgi:biotin operon repressor
MSTDLLYKNLLELGLEPLEANLYLALLHQKYFNLSKLAIGLGISRVTLYQSISQMRQKGFIEKKLEKAAAFPKIVSPQIILGKLQQKSAFLSTQTEQLDKLMPKIMSLYDTSGKDSVVSFYQGKSQFQALFMSLLQQNKPIIHFGSNEIFAELVGYQFLELYVQQRLAKKILTREITFDFNYLRSRRAEFDNDYTFYKFLPKNTEKPGSYVVVGDTISLWNPVLPRIITINDPILAEFFRFNFETLWELLP